MRRNIATVLAGIVVIAIVTNILSSKDTVPLIQRLGKIFDGSINAALHPEDTSLGTSAAANPTTPTGAGPAQPITAKGPNNRKRPTTQPVPTKP